MVQRIFVYEYVSGGGAVDSDQSRAAPPADAGAALQALRAEGQAMRDALLADLCALPDVAVTAVSTGTEAGAVPGPAVGPTSAAHGGACAAAADGGAGRLRWWPLRPGEAPPDLLRRAAAAHDVVWAVAPETGGVLARLAGAVAAPQWLGCTRAAIAVCGSKARTLAALHAAGIATPLAFDGHAADWVVKPDDGAGALATRRHAGRAAAAADLQSRLRRGAAATCEPWVDGEALSLSLSCGADHAELLAINRQRVAVAADGAVVYDGVDVAAWPLHGARAEALRALAAGVAQAVPGLRGVVGVDVVWHPARGPVVIEINPRLTAAYIGLSQAIGRNVAGLVLDRHGG